MGPILAALLSLGIAVAAFRQARRAGLWSWRRFLVTVALLTVLGGGVGAIVASLGRHTREDHALALTVLATLAIGLGVAVLAVRLRRR
jgi:uncharacterized membrane protein YsdA (DUF1294 family)